MTAWNPMRQEFDPGPTLADFLLARIDEDEGVAQAAGPSAPMRSTLRTTLDALANGERTGPRGTVEAEPARVLAECEAKRRIVELHSWVHGDTPVERHLRFCSDDLNPWPCPTLRLLALPYADHEHYRQEWRP